MEAILICLIIAGMIAGSFLAGKAFVHGLYPKSNLDKISRTGSYNVPNGYWSGSTPSLSKRPKRKWL